jgi:hypothetical protein
MRLHDVVAESIRCTPGLLVNEIRALRHSPPHFPICLNALQGCLWIAHGKSYPGKQ